MRKRNMIARKATKATTPMTMPAMAPAERASWWALPVAVGVALLAAELAVPLVLLRVVREAELVGMLDVAVVEGVVDCRVEVVG